MYFHLIIPEEPHFGPFRASFACKILNHGFPQKSRLGQFKTYMLV